MKATYLLAAVMVASLSACGVAGGSAAPVVTVTATEPAPTVTVTGSASPATPTKDETPTPTPTDKPVVAEKKTLPDVVGMNLQAAQDRLQAAGFYLLNDKDATGQGRFQVFDRDWVVTGQKPAGGQKVPTDTLIVLYAKKYGE
jgi:hypothetical protein